MSGVLADTVFAAGESAQVEAALNARLVARHLEALEEGSGNGAVRACRILDAKYEPGWRCTVLYELGDRYVLGVIGWGAPEQRVADAGRSIEALGMRVYDFPNDPSIPGLAAALVPGAMERVLAETLPECVDGGARPLRAPVTLLRYRPGRRCTLRVDVRLRTDGRSKDRVHIFYAKLYHDVAKAEAVFREMSFLYSDTSLQASACRVARPVAYVAPLGLVLQEHLEGVPLDASLRRKEGDAGEGLGELRAVARAVAVLHRSRVVVERCRPIAPAVARLEAQARAAEIVSPDFGGRMLELAGALAGALPNLARWGEETSLVHGDCKPSQFFVGPKGVAILDFDHCGMADPASDVGNFIATLRQHAARHELKARAARVWPARAPWLRGLEQGFVNAYLDAAGGGGELERRIRWYQSASLVRKAYRSWQRSARSPLPQALLQEACHCPRRVGDECRVD